MCVCLPAYADTYCAGFEGRYIVFDDSGSILINSGQYAPVIDIGDGLFTAEDESGVRILDSTAAPLDEYHYDRVEKHGEYILYCINGLWGIADTQMHRIFDSVYTAVSYAGDGSFIALKTGYNDLSADRVYVLDAAGSEAASEIRVLYGLNGFSCGLSPAVSENGLMGYMTGSGEWASEPVYSYASSYNRSGYAVVTLGGRAGVIDTSGSVILECTYEKICLADNVPIAYALDSDGVHVIDLTGGTAPIIVEGDGIFVSVPKNADNALITGQGISGLYDTAGKMVMSFEGMTSVSAAYSEGVYIIYSDTGSIMLDRDGNVIFSSSGDIRPDGGGYFLCRDDGALTVLDASGTTIGKVDCEALLTIGRGTFTVRADGRMTAYTSDLTVSCVIG